MIGRQHECPHHVALRPQLRLDANHSRFTFVCDEEGICNEVIEEGFFPVEHADLGMYKQRSSLQDSALGMYTPMMAAYVGKLMEQNVESASPIEGPFDDHYWDDILHALCPRSSVLGPHDEWDILSSFTIDGSRLPGLAPEKRSHVLDLWCTGSHAESRGSALQFDNLPGGALPLPLQLKPDGNTEYPGAIEWQPQPESSHDVMQFDAATAFSAAQDDAEQDAVLAVAAMESSSITIISYGFDRHYVGRRELEIRLEELPDWRVHLMHQWRDHAPQPPFYIWTIKPAPDEGHNCFSVIVQCGPNRVGYNLVLLDITFDDETASRLIVEVPLIVMHSTLLHAAGVLDWIESTAVIKHGATMWLRGFPQVTHSGDYIRALLSRTEAISLVQRQASRSRSPRPPSGEATESDDESEGEEVTRVRTSAYRMVSVHKKIHIDPNGPLCVQFAAGLRRNDDDVFDCHQVNHPPDDHVRDGDPVWIVELYENHRTQVHPTDVLCLLDLNVDDWNGRQSTPTRQVMWIPSVVTRAELLQYLRCHHFCLHTNADRCTLWLNRNVWPITDTMGRQIVAGDYIKLVIVAPPHIRHSSFMVSLQDDEARERNRRVYTYIPTSSTSESDSEDSSQHSQRHPTSSVDSESQHDQTHVSDRWCSAHAEATLSTVIELDSCLPAPARYAHIDAHRLGLLHTRLKTLWIPPHDMHQTDLEWHPATINGWTQTLPWKGQFLEEIHFYIDGSSIFSHQAGERRAGLAVAFLGTQGPLLFWGGLQARKVDGTATSPLAETCGLLQAILWAHSLLNEFPWLCQSHFHFWGDAIGPGHFVKGDWYPNAHLDQVNCSRELFFWLEERVQHSCQWHHVKAHNGCPWNECVDVVARAVAEDILLAPQFSDLWKEVINDEIDRNAIGWLWFREKLEAHPQPDILCSPTDIVIKLPEAPHANFGSQLTINNVWKKWAHGDSPVEEEAAIQVVSANVLSLFAGKGDKLAQGHYVSSRMEELQWQCKNAGVDIVGLQETRHRAGHYFSCEHYHVLSGAATVKGHGGTQIWIAKTLQCGLSITPEHLRTVYQDSQLLIACLQHPAISLVIVTAHAPTSDKDTEAGQWWNQVTLKLKLCPKWPVIGLFDANSRVGSKVSPSVGDHGGSHENVAGAMFHEWLLQHEMWLPSTFATSHHGDHHTWYHATGASARLDYVVLSKCFKDLEVQSWVSKDIDLSLQRVDHVPVCCSLKVKLQASNGNFTPKQQRQQNGRGEPNNINFASIPWKLNVHEHADQLDVTLRTLQEGSSKARRLRKQHLTDPTWTLIKAKRNCWRQILLMRSHLRQGFLREVWSAWRHQVRPEQYKPTLYSFQAWLRWSDFETARWLYLHKHFATLAAKAVREDDRGYYEDLAKRAGDTDTHHGLQKLWGEVAAMLPKAQNRRRNNTTAQQPPLEEMQCHFDQLEAGEPMEFEDLAADCLRQQLLHQAHATCSFQLSTLPSRLTMERLCLRTIPGKAAGLDRVSPNIVRHQAPIVGKALFELVMKAWMTGSEPISWKGGLQIALWKGKGSKQTPASYRGIVLLSALAKRWHALLRQQLLPHVLQQKLDTQYGGFPGQQPGFATCAIRSISNIAHANGLSDACLFLDLRSAFHHLIRQAAWNFGETAFTPTLCEALDNEGIDAAALQARVRGGQHYGVLPLPSHLNNLLVDLHTSTWYTLKGSSGPSATHRGTRPGSPFADLGFNAFMSQVMIIIREFLWQQADLTSAMHSVNLEPVVIGWVDDLAIPILSTNAEALLNTIKTVTEGVVRIMWEAGLQINLGKGKTECVATFRGRKAPAVRSQTFVNDKGQIGIEIPRDGNAQLHLVGQYVHLGTCFGQGLHFGGEINRRIGAATTTFRQLSKPLFANRRISIPTRLQLLEALVCSKLMYNSGVWPQLTGRQHQKLEHTIIGWQRRIINQGFWSEELVRDEVLQRRWQLPTLAVRLAVARIRFALAASRNPMETTWRLIGLEFEGCSRSWCQLLLPALQWLVDVIPKAQFFDERCEDLNFQQITEWLQSEQRPHKGVIKRALQKHLLQERIIQEVRDGYEEVRSIFQGLGLYKPEQEVQEGSASNFTCEVCDMKFGNAQKLQVHRWSKHGLVSVERQFVFGPVCASCGVNFWTPQRVQQHLRYSRLVSDGCFERLRRYKSSFDFTGPV